MALSGPVPPWLNIGPNTFLNAMEGGGRLGVAARAQDVKQEAAADRLQLAYEQLSAKEQMENEALQGKLQLGQMQLDAKSEADAQRNAFIAQRLGIQEAHNTALEKLGQERLKLMGERMKAGGRAATPSPFLKKLTEYWDLAEQGRQGDTKAQYMAEAEFEDINRSLSQKDPLVRQKATALMKTMRDAHLIATAPNVDAGYKRKAMLDFQSAAQGLTNLMEPAIPPLQLTPLMTGPKPGEPAPPESPGALSAPRLPIPITPGPED